MIDNRIVRMNGSTWIASGLMRHPKVHGIANIVLLSKGDHRIPPKR